MDTATNRTSDRADIREYIRPLLRRWWLILGVAVVVAVVTYQHFDGQPTRYTSSTRLLIEPSALNGLFDDQPVYSNPDRLANNQATLLQSVSVAERVAKQLGFRGDPRALLGAVSVAPVPETDFLSISATTGSPQLSAEIANGFARAYKGLTADEARRRAQKAITAAEGQMDRLGPGSRTYAALQAKVERLSVVRDLPPSAVRQLDPAVPSASSAGPSALRNAIFGFVVALMLAGGAAYALDTLDRRIRRVGDLEGLYDAPVLAELPHVRDTVDSVDGRLAVPAPLVEGFRGLRTSLQLKASLDSRFGSGELGTILIASAIAGEGKSTVVRNLAIAYCESGLNVAVVDADLRKPTLTRGMADDAVPGVLEVLTGAATIDEALRPVPLQVEGLATIARVEQAGLSHGAVKVAATVAPEPPAQARPAAPAPTGMLRRLIAGGTASVPSSTPAPRPAPTAVHGNGNGNGNGNGSASRGQLALLTSGSAAADPGAVLASRQFHALLNELAERHDVVLIDSSPLLPVSDARSLLFAVDGVILTSRVGVTTRTAARHVVQTVKRVPGAEILGIVANDVKPSEGQASYGYGYGYGQYGSTRGSSRGG